MQTPYTTRISPGEAISTKLVFWFAALGPIGNLIPVPGTPASFRFFYLLLIPGIVLNLYKGISERTMRTMLLLSPVVIYMMISSVWFYLFNGSSFEGGEEGNPLFRFALLMSLLFFTVLAGDQASGFTVSQKLEVVLAFMKGYIVSVVAGYALFFAFYTHLIGLRMLEHFEILVQFGFGLLRFSPGSYPNEYGLVSSFALSVITIFFFYRQEIGRYNTPLFRVGSRIFLVACFGLTLGALFLATTRAAYIGYLLSICYIAFSQGGLRKAGIFAARVFGGTLLLLLCVQPFFDVISIFAGGYRAFFDPRRPASGRLDAWNVAYSLFIDRPLLGAGFSSVDMMHNVYLQLFFGLGVVGFSLLLATALVLYLRTIRLGRPSSSPQNGNLQILLLQIRAIALIHVLWFALSNHNLNHFLTWFAVLLSLMVLPSEKTDRLSTPISVCQIPAI